MAMYMAVTMDWQMMSERVKRRGSRISEAMGKNPGVPAYANTKDEIAEIASSNEGLPMILKSDFQGPV